MQPRIFYKIFSCHRIYHIDVADMFYHGSNGHRQHKEDGRKRELGERKLRQAQPRSLTNRIQIDLIENNGYHIAYHYTAEDGNQLEKPLGQHSY